jgi:hypothetical protein
VFHYDYFKDIKKEDINEEKLNNYFKSLKEFLINLYITMESLRNYYTHYEHEPVTINAEIFHFLQKVLLYNADNIRKGRLKNETVKESLKKKYGNELRNFIKDYYKDKEKKKKIKTKDELNFVINRSIETFLFVKKEKENIAVELRNSMICGQEGNLTQNGFVLLLSLLLDTKQLNTLFENIEYSGKEFNIYKQVIRWVFTYSSYKSIRYLFKSDFDTDGLLLQMANELNKAPKHLYPYLSEKDKQEFIEDINVYLQDKASQFTDKTLVSHEVVRKRYEDKFAYFALRFLDDVVQMPSLRFQVNVGKFHHDTKPKTYESTKLKTERSILEKLTVFEKLTIVTQKKIDYFEKII